MQSDESRLPGRSLGFIGGGKMAEALAAAMTAKGVISGENLIISDPMEDRRTLLEEKYGFRVTDSNMDVVDFADTLILAVKPQQMETLIAEIKPELKKSKLIISIAAGIRIERLSNAFPGARVIRVMPNTPCLIGEMAAGYAAGRSVTGDDIALVETLLGAAGAILRMDETLLDAVTGLSGSGPAFVAFLIDSFIKAGAAEGLPFEIARELTLRTFSGTARLLAEKNLSPEELIKQVSSPGGTTLAGRNILENGPVRESIMRTIAAAAERSRELANK